MGLVLLLLGAEQRFRQLPREVLRSIALMGDLSFATYIFHVYVMGAVKRTVGLDIDVYLYTTIVFACTGVVAAGMFFLVERPSRTFFTGIVMGPAEPRGIEAAASAS